MPAFRLLTEIDTYVVSSWGGDDDHIPPLQRWGAIWINYGRYSTITHIIFPLPMYVHIRFGAHHANSGNKKNSALLQQRKNNSPLSVCPQQPEQTYATPQAKPPASRLINASWGKNVGRTAANCESWNIGVASSSLCASDWTFLLSFSWRLNSLHNTSARIACVFLFRI